MSQRMPPLMIVLSTAWIGILGTLGISALMLKRLVVSTRAGISESNGIQAEVMGWILIGFALLGVLPWLDRHRFKRQIHALLVLGWIAGAAAYFVVRH